MEKTELMKRYEAETGLRKDSIKMQHAYDSFIDGFVEFAQEEYDDLQIKNAKLRSHLIWRSISEQPEEEGWYLIMERFYQGHNATMATVGYFDGKQFSYRDVTHWLPIPELKESDVCKSK